MHTTIKDPSKLKMQLLMKIPKMTLWKFCFIKRAKIHSEIKAPLNQDQTFLKTHLVVVKFVNQCIVQVLVHANVLVNCQMIVILHVNHHCVKLLDVWFLYFA
jgi:hypothetical protein